MPLLAGPVRTSSRTGWGAVVGLGVGALLPAALAATPGGAQERPAPRQPLAQDAFAVRAVGLAGVATGRGRLRLGAGPLPVTPGWAVAVPTQGVPGQEVPSAAASAAVSAAASAAVQVGPCAEQGWFSPAPGAAVSQVFGVPDREYAAGYHTGVDFAVLTGTPLLAIADAVVETAGWGGAYGNWIVLRLPDRHFALYAHMSRLDVRSGQRVTAGTTLGLSGESGHARGPHLHFEIRTENRYGAVVDPVPYLRGHGCRL